MGGCFLYDTTIVFSKSQWVVAVYVTKQFCVPLERNNWKPRKSTKNMIYDTYEYKNLPTEPLQKRIKELKCSKTGNNIGIAILFMANVGSLCLIVNLIRAQCRC